MLATLPLVPVFMILVGSHTARRTQERSEALTLLATHFLDVVRGLPTLRAFNRGTAQTAAIAERGERYRRATIATLRISFLSGAVLDLAATLGVALVAVSVGLRLDAGHIGLESALVILILAPELYLPLRNVGALYHASADGVAVVDRLLPLAEPRRAAPGRRPAATQPGRRRGPARACLVWLPGPPGARPQGRRPRAASGRGRGARRPDRKREEHDRRGHPRARRPDSGARHGRRRRSRPV